MGSWKVMQEEGDGAFSKSELQRQTQTVPAVKMLQQTHFMYMR